MAIMTFDAALVSTQLPSQLWWTLDVGRWRVPASAVYAHLTKPKRAASGKPTLCAKPPGTRRDGKRAGWSQRRLWKMSSTNQRRGTAKLDG